MRVEELSALVSTPPACKQFRREAPEGSVGSGDLVPKENSLCAAKHNYGGPLVARSCHVDRECHFLDFQSGLLAGSPVLVEATKPMYVESTTRRANCLTNFSATRVKTWRLSCWPTTSWDLQR